MRALALFVVLAVSSLASAQGTIRVGAKNFTESAVLAELMAQVIEEQTDLVVERRTGIGGTMLCWAQLMEGGIDVYAEYTGTGWATILKRTDKVSDPLQTFAYVQRRCLAEHGVHWLEPLGLNNTYALAMPEAKAQALGIRTISDLRAHQDSLRVGFGVEFGNRNDGYVGLARAYDLAFANMRTLEHALAYEAVQAGDIDLIDAYSTDGKLRRFDLRVLEDDRRFLPPYNAAPVVRAAVMQRYPQVGEALAKLAFRITDVEAQQLNYEVEAGDREIAVIVRDFLVGKQIVEPDIARAAGEGYVAKLLRWLWQHLCLTGTAVLLAVVLAVPFGIAASRRQRLRALVLAAAGVLQTVPSLALLVFMIPLLGTGVQAAMAALFLYALLPIARNTCTGISGVAPDLVDAARGMGMRPSEIMRHVELPLAMPTIMAGVRTAAVISVGTATLAALIGAGGLGTPIVEGLYLNDVRLILSGAVPAALLAIVVDVLLGAFERRLTPGPAGTRSP